MRDAISGDHDETVIRPGCDTDLVSCTNVWRATVDPSLPNVDEDYPLYRHELETGSLLVAESAGRVIGFAGSVSRGDRWFLGDLFVDPAHHGRGVGRRLLDELVDRDAPGPVRATMASDDPRALTLYTQLGMTPRWPCFSLLGSAERTRPMDRTAAPAAEQCTTGELVASATASDYPLSTIDLDYWQRTVPSDLVLVADLGGAVIRWSTPFSVAHPDAISVGPLFATSPDHLPAVVASALDRVRSIDDRSPVKLYVPGPSPALRPLLDAGYRIEEFDLFSSSTSVLEPGTVLPSHDLL